MRPATPKASDSCAVSAMGGALEWLNPSNDGPFNILSGSCRGSAMEQLLLGWAHAHTRGNRTTRFRMRTSSAKQHNIIQNKIRNMKLPQQLLALNFCRFGGFCGSVIPVFYYRPYPLVFLFFCAFARLRSLFPLIYWYLRALLCCAGTCWHVGLISWHVIFVCFLRRLQFRRWVSYLVICSGAYYKSAGLVASILNRSWWLTVVWVELFLDWLIS